MTTLLLTLFLTQVPLERAHRHVVTSDGSSLVLYSIQKEHLSQNAPAVLMIPDFGFGKSLFDAQGKGLAPYLASKGFRVFIAEMRGQGSASPFYSMQDLPEDFGAIESALKTQGVDQLTLISHGWMGSYAMSLYAKAKALVSFATPAVAEKPSDLATLFLLNGMPLRTCLENEKCGQLFLYDSILPVSLKRTVQGETLKSDPRLAAALFSLWKHGDFTFLDGTTWRQRLRKVKVPTLMINVHGNDWAPPELCVPFREISNGPVTLKYFQALSGGSDFSHVGMLQSDEAKDTIYPTVLEFLKELK
jgi:pimeloyl-ACP methyl ester carboxylesterase